MMDDKRPLVMELVHILYRRNQIEVRRRKAKSKIGYYEEIKRTIKSYREAQSKVTSLARSIRAFDTSFGEVSLDRLNEQLEAAKKQVAAYDVQKMKPFKWMDRVSELNKRILKHRAEYMKARYDTARLTCQTRKRVGRLTTELKANINYQFGTAFVQSLSIDNNAERIESKEFEKMFREVDANKAIEKALRSKNEEEKEGSN